MSIIVAIFCCLTLQIFCADTTAIQSSFGNQSVNKKGTGSPDSSQLQCHESQEYFIIEKELAGEIDTDFLIKYKANPETKFKCSYVPRAGDLEIKNEWAEYFFELKNDLLILDSTTGPGPSGLVIWDLAKKKRAFTGIGSYFCGSIFSIRICGNRPAAHKKSPGQPGAFQI